MAEQKVIDKAKAWVDKEYDELRYDKCEQKRFTFTFWELREMGKQAFIAGYEAALEEENGWHNIKRNPQDLPKKSGVYLIVELQYGRPGYDMALYWPDSREFTGSGCGSLDVMAWHKLPAYEAEK